MWELYEVEDHYHIELLVSYGCREQLQQVEVVYVAVVSYLDRLVKLSYT